ncbi:MAG: arginine--tRNA ligase [Clostridia bacterium]|nr:arginine--tRNA ligase [Clostridia bacterium]
MLIFKNKAASIVSAAVNKLWGQDVTSSDVADMFEYPPDPAMGDIALPCFKLSRTLKKSPVMIADAISDALDDSVFDKVESVGGYLNLTASSDFLKESLLGIIEEGERYGSSDEGKGKTVTFDYSSPNICKPFHIGHLGTTVIGHSLKLLHEFAGYKCIGINHLGDWGTQFGKQIVAFRKWGDREAVERIGIDELVRLYVKFHEEAEKDPSLDDEARAEFHKLEEGDPDNIALWQWFVDVSLEEYKNTYRQLNIEFDYYTGESFYIRNGLGMKQVDSLKEKGLLKPDDGAYIVDLSEYDMPPCIILKKDGSTIYHTRDIAAAVYRKETYDFSKSVYVTSAQQSLHFAQLFKVIELMGYDWYKDLVHIPYGTVSIDGAKLATRTGNVVLLKDLFAKSIEKVTSIIKEKNPDLEDIESTAEAVGVGAIVFLYLSNNRIKDINFNLENALSFDGNTGPYAQYTYARTCSVLEKAKPEGTCGSVTVPEESDVIKSLLKFPEKVAQALEDYEPSVITRYIIEVCTSFNRFYHACQILKADDPEVKNFRLTLTLAVNNVLRTALHLICMKTPSKI